MMAVAWGHPFKQGNKRTGFAAAQIFLETNGWLLDIGDWTEIADQIIACIEDGNLEADLVEIFRGHLVETN